MHTGFGLDANGERCPGTAIDPSEGRGERGMLLVTCLIKSLLKETHA